MTQEEKNLFAKASEEQAPVEGLAGAEAKALIDEIVHGTFVTEGTFVAFPLCFPGASVPMALDESHITALDITPDGLVYGGTSGWATHLFVGMFHGVTGAVFDMGAVDGATQCPAIVCGQGYFIACVNGPSGGRLIRRELQRLPFDLIQEWGFRRPPYEELGSPIEGERLVHAVADTSGQWLVAATQGHLVVTEFAGGQPEIVASIGSAGRLACGSQGGILGFESDADSKLARTLWCYHPESGGLERHAFRLPEGTWHAPGVVWASDPVDGTLYLASSEGLLYAFTERDGFSQCLGQLPLAPAGPTAVTFDGRVFGSCGEGICKLFCYNPATSEITQIGAAASVIERRRYGYQFGAAVTGRDGEIVFGEDDNLGHLWLYFPRIQRRPADAPAG